MADIVRIETDKSRSRAVVYNGLRWRDDRR